MGLRGKLRKHFGGSSSKTSTPAGGAATLHPDEQLYTNRTDIEYYKPTEIPRPKYRGKVDPLHEASLRAYSFPVAFDRAFLVGSSQRRKSDAAMSGTYSPGGTKSRSRITSAVNSRAASRRPSLDMTLASRLNPDGRAQSESSDSTSSSSSGSASRSEKDDTTDTPGTSLSQHDTAVPSVPSLSNHFTFHTVVNSQPPEPDTALHKTPSHDTPFTLEELEQAISRASLNPRDFNPAHDQDREDDKRRRMTSVGRRTSVYS